MSNATVHVLAFCVFAGVTGALAGEQVQWAVVVKKSGKTQPCVGGQCKPGHLEVDAEGRHGICPGKKHRGCHAGLSQDWKPGVDIELESVTPFGRAGVSWLKFWVHEDKEDK